MQTFSECKCGRLICFLVGKCTRLCTYARHGILLQVITWCIIQELDLVCIFYVHCLNAS